MICPRCGEENPDRARFCMACTAPLTAEAPAREERKVVSVLFVDLVGFTAASESADPEDVRARLQAYHARAKGEIERYGGTVEKFVGDAVMAAFGAPVAHEDDAERAVRAGLAILDAMRELELEARAAVNTGEAVVALEARPELGEGIVTGDVVNTAARLQSAAPSNCLIVGEQTYWATRHMIDYEPLDPVSAKGKSEPVAAWLARGARSRFGVDVEPSRATPFLGRDDELEVLRQVYARTLRESAAHLVTLVGEPGIGKSRLTAELREYVHSRPEIVFWRQGRCLPYGEGIAMWALGEIVKAHAGILESDDPETAREKLAQTLEPIVPNESDRTWMLSELGRLIGAGEGAGDREQSFTAWRSFLEAVAAQRPLVLVVEDLHWADASLLEFLEHLVDWSTEVPLLVLCTARPELYELHPAWSGGKRNATTISLSALSADDTARLIAALLDRSVLPAETQQQLLERAGGNPLYAEQFVRMRQERSAGEEIAVPETLQALIAARLDTLGSERKALLQDAAVVGKVFWAGAVAAVGGADERAVREGLHELVRRELVRPSRLSSVEGQAEFAFGHGLVRDVAYAQIPRAARAGKHEAAAKWIETIAGERVADYAELLAHHYTEALALARAANLETGELEATARRFLVLAAEQAASIDLHRTDALFTQALDLTPAGHPERGRILVASVQFGLGARPVDETLASLDEAAAELRAAGDEVGVGQALSYKSRELWAAGDTERADQILDEAIALLERHPPGPELADAYGFSTGRYAIGGRPELALPMAEKAIALSERLGLDSLKARTLQLRGIAKCDLGDLSGVDDIRDGWRSAIAHGWVRESTAGFSNFGTWTWLSRGAEDAIAIYEDGIEFLSRRGNHGGAVWCRAESTWPLFDLGRWDDLLESAELVEAFAAERGASQPLLMALASKARVLFYRGRVAEAAAISRDLLPRARTAQDPQVISPALSLAALVEQDAGVARALLEELVTSSTYLFYPDVARACVRHGAEDVAERIATPIESPVARTRNVALTTRAVLAEVRGERDEAVGLYADAARRWEEYSFTLERALCLLGAARNGGDAAMADEARSILRSLGADALAREEALPNVKGVAEA
jgi:class 3 adenylate cyclase/tetratricopeptide (TPR) repeat protein